jgi:parvulin-like peptidyl-prolyl isomerase
VLRHVVLPARLFALAAASAGLEQDPEYLASLARRREELLLAALYRRVVDAQVPVTDAEERAYYDAFPGKFTSPPTTVAVEILVAADSLAQRLKSQLQAGADAEALARQHSIRPGAAAHDGRIRLNEYNRPAFPGVYEAVAGLEVGQVGGPVPTAGGYSVVKVVDRRREKAPYDEQTRRLARSHVRAEKGRQEYARYVRELRGRHRVTVYEESLRR